MRHDVDRHVHLSFADGLFDGIGDKELEGAEGQGMQHDADPTHLVALAQDTLHLGADVGALLLIGRVDVEEVGLATQGFDVGDETLRIGLSGLAVEMHAEDVHARPRQRHARGRAKAGRGAEDERPAGEPYRFRVRGHRNGLLVGETREHSIIPASGP